jgi:tetrahydromethanopterin S-methyltransferase subunit G
MDFNEIERRLDEIAHRQKTMCSTLNTLSTQVELNKNNISNKEKSDRTIAVVIWAMLGIIISLLTYIEQLQINANTTAVKNVNELFDRDTQNQWKEIDSISHRLTDVEKKATFK